MELKIAMLFIVVSVSNMLASPTYSQVAKVSLDMKNTSLEQVLDEIERQSEYYFIFNQKQIDVNRIVDIQDDNKLITDILPELFKGTNVNYAVLDRKILLTTDPINDNLLNISTESVQQQGLITGKITDETGSVLPGVNIKVEGTAIGAISDIGGLYSLNVPNENSVLVFSFIGYKTQTVSVAGKTIIDISLTPDLASLDEVVVIGYGTQRKIEVTSSVANVKSENFIKGSVKDAGELLKGKVAGLSIITPSGDPTASSQILLRGTATLNTSTQPLILIDGIPGDMSTVAPGDVESVDVLKDGSAAAIYGTRGTNGVILITTRKANGSIQPTISYEGYFSTQKFIRVPQMLNAAEYRQKLSEGVAFVDNGATTDWQKEISRSTPLSHNHNIAVRGGNTKTNYVATMNYRKLEGVILKSEYQTINSRIDINHSMFNDKLKINVNLLNNDNKTGIPFSQYSEALSDVESSNIFNQALYRNPTSPVMNPDGSWNEEPSISYYVNPVGLLMESYGGVKDQSTRISGNVTYEPVKGLLFKILGSRNKYNSQSGLGNTKRHLSSVKDGYNGYASKSTGESISKLLEMSAQYQKTINEHKFTALAGYSYQEDEWASSFMRNWNFPAGNFSYIDNIGVGQRIGMGGPNMMNSSKYESNLIGFYGRLTYNYKEKYLLMANLRYEASSKFVGTKEPWGTFPAISAGWRISEEEFMKGLAFLNNLKIRAGYGVTGTAPDQYFLGLSLLGYQGASLINGQWVPSLSPVSNPNPYLRWEEKKETNIGFDFGILKDRISGSFDLYKRTTDGLLYDYSVPTPPNAYGTTKANVGVMENKGFEMLINVIPVQKNKFSWNLSATFSTNKNKLVSLSNDLYATTNPWFNAGYTGSPIQTYTHRVEVGKAIGNFYGYKVTGVTNDGRWIYEDKDGNPSETRVEDDKKIIGNGLPKYFASINNTFRLGNFDLDITMRGAFGFQLLNYQRMYSENPGFTSYNLMKSAFDKVYGIAVLDKNVPVEYNSYYLEDGDYWKIDNITLGYNFGTSKINHIGDARLYFSVLNAFMITGYKGMDPEVNSLGLTPGNDNRNKYPTTRVMSIGLKVTFN